MQAQGTLSLVRLILRRDRFYLSLWLLGLFSLAVFCAPLLPDMIGDEASRQALILAMENPAMVALFGPSFSTDYSTGALYAQFMLLWAALGYALFNIMFVIRHTRGDEERGRLELISAQPVGRNANILATMAVMLAADIVLAVTVSVIQPLFAVEGIDWAGSAVYALALSACGLGFAGLAAIAAQLADRAKGALGLGVATLGVAWLLRAAGDASTSANALSFISPLGLAEQSQAFVANLVWPSAVLALEGLVFFALATILQARRDSGSALLPARRARVRASRFLQGEWGFIWRQTRGVIAAWALTCLVLAASFGSVMGEMNSFIENNALYQSLISVTPGMATSDISEPVVAMLMLMMAIIATVPVLTVVNHLLAEERHGRMEQTLSTATSRWYLFAGYLLVATVAAVLMQLASALGFFTAAAVSLPEPMDLGMVLAASFNYLPAQLVFAGLAALLAGLSVRLSGLAWAALIYAFVAFYLGRLADFPEAATKLSPFGVLPAYPTQELDPALSLGLVLLAAVLATAGAVVYRRRDVRG
ncbi:MAG: hypothetical protein LBP28_06055 [Coriobacteriales bacterium]|jgi:ABC-2 type transport system permease protein|nr:hypothetical protein [Coriobacteriales bacterium]